MTTVQSSELKSSQPLSIQRRKAVIVVGDGACGKTTLLHRFFENKFLEQYVPTLSETRVVNYTTAEGQKVELVIWDTAGKYAFDSMRCVCFSDTDVILLCFAIDSHLSLDNATHKWVSEIRRFCPKTPPLLVGNKSDLRQQSEISGHDQPPHPKRVEAEEASRAADGIAAFSYFENSAKTGEGIQDLFQAACRAVLSRRRTSSISERCKLT